MSSFTRGANTPAGASSWSRIIRLVASLAVLVGIVQLIPAEVNAGTIPETSTLTVIEPGAYIIDMGVTPQTVNNGLKPYGLIYELMISERIPVTWIINDGKAKDGADFTYNAKTYSGGAFLIDADYAAEAAPIIAQWVTDNPGLTVDGPTTSPFQAPVFDVLTNWPNAILDSQNGKIAQEYYVNAGIPRLITAGDGSTKTAYEFKAPSQLDQCDDLYVMPHADPEWATHSNLVPWNDQGGFIWAACHAVSVLENVTDPGDPDPDPEMNFLSTNGLIDFGDHDDGTPPYSYATALGGDPIMQFLGDIDDATLNGSEQIYLPATGSAWRPSTTMLAWDPDQADLISQGGTSPGEAGVLLYGRGFGDPNNGYVMYEAGHSHNKGSADDVAAQRAFLNLNLTAGIERGIDVDVDAPEVIVGGSTVPVSASISGGHPAYDYDWVSTCGGTFDQVSGTLPGPDTVTTSFTAPLDAQDCTVRVIVDDTCGRFSFAADGFRVVEQADLSITKTDGAAGAEDGGRLTYSLTVGNAGPTDATNTTVTDTLPAEVTFLTAAPSQGSCRFDGVDVICDLGTVVVGGSASIDIVVRIDDGFLGTVTNTATVSADQDDPVTGNNADTDDTVVSINGLQLQKTATPDFITQGELAGGGGSVDVTYDLVVTNTGPNPLTDVAVSDDTCGPVVPIEIMAGVNIGDTANIGTLDPGEAWEYRCIAPVSNDTDNIASASATDPVIGTIGAEDTAHVEVIAPDFTITKSPDGGEHSAGGQVVFDIVVSNTGDVDLTDIVVTDPGAPGCDRYLGPMAAGDSISYSCALDPTPPAGTSDTNTISADATTPSGGALTRSDTAPYTVIDRDLAITKEPIDCTTGSPLVEPAFYAGDTVCYRIVVDNTRTVTHESVTVSDVLPDGISWSSTTVTSPSDLVTEDWSGDPASAGWLYGWVEVDNDDRTGGDIRHEDSGAGDLAVRINKLDEGLFRRYDFSAADSVTVDFQWQDDDGDNIGGVSLATYDEVFGTWTRLFTFPTPPTVFGPATATLTAASFPALFGSDVAFGFVGDSGERVYVDDVEVSWLSGATTLGAFSDALDWSITTDYSQGWLEIGDDDKDDGGDVRVTNGSRDTDCLDSEDCVLQIKDKDRGIYFPVDLSSGDYCVFSFDWATLDSRAGSPGSFDVVGWDDNLSTYVTLGTTFTLDDPDTNPTPIWHDDVSVAFDTVTYPSIFDAAGRIGLLSGPGNTDGDDEILFDDLSINCLDTFAGGAAPNLVTTGDSVDLASGQQMTVTVETTVDPATSPFPRELSNVAGTTSAQQTTPSEALATVERVVAGIDLTKLADPVFISPGDSVNYSFEVANSGNEVLENVTVTDSDIPGCTPGYVGGDNGDGLLDLDEVWIYTCTAIPPGTDPTFTNTATAQGDPVTPGTGATLAVTDTGSALVEIVNSSVAISKTADRLIIRPEEPVEYTYDISVSLAGTTEPLTGVYVEDDHCSPVVGPTGGDDGDGILEDGESWTYACTTTLSVTTTNIATVHGTDRASVDVTGSDNLTVTVIEPAISLDKSVSPTTINPGDTVTYTIAATNDGNDPFSAVAVNDDTCSPLVGPSGDGGNGLLDPGETWTYTCTATPSDDVTNIATVTGVDSLGKTWTAGDDAVVNVLEPSLAVAKLPDLSLILAGQDVTYTFLVFNDGDYEFTTVDVTDPLCPDIIGPGGDNGDGVLSPDEGWLYTCTTPLAVTTLNTVTVGADGPGGAVSVTDSATVRTRDPQLSLVKSADASIVTPGTSVTYTFEATNTSVCAPGDTTCEQDHELTDVTVGDDHCASAPAYVSGDTGTTGIMEIGETWLFQCSEAVDSPTTNTAVATADDVLGVEVTSDTGQAFVDVYADPELTMVKSGPASARVGQTVTYSFEVSNVTDCAPHPDPAWCAISSWVDTLTVSDDVAGPATATTVGGFNVGDTDGDGLLDVGETFVFSATYTVTGTDLSDRDPLVNLGTATGTDRDGDTASAADNHSLDVQAQQSDLSVDKDVSDTTPDVGDTVTFTIEVANDGPDDATGVTVEDQVPAGFSGLTNISGGGVLVGSTITWSGLGIAASDSITLTFDAVVDAPTGTPGEHDNRVQLTAADQFDPDSDPATGFGVDDLDDSGADDDEATSSVVPRVADVRIAKLVNTATPNVGDTLTYTVQVTNDGPDTATNLTVQDVVPSGLTYLDGSIDGGDGRTDSAAPTLEWTVSTLASGSSLDLTYQAVVLAPSGLPAEYDNGAQVTAVDQWDPDSDPAVGIGVDDGTDGLADDDEAVTPIVPLVADLELTKSVSSATPNVGDTVTFTIVVTNAGPDPATAIVVTDVVPSGYSGTTNISDGGVLAGSTITWSSLSLAAAGDIELTFDAAVDPPTGAPDEYVNTAQVTDVDQFDPDSAPGNDDGDQSEDDEDNASVVPRQVDLSLTKKISDPTPNVGDTVTFTLTIANAGPDAATEVDLEDVVPTGYSNVADISDGGLAVGSTVAWTDLSVPAAGSVTVTFDATVEAPPAVYDNVAQVTAVSQFDPDSAPNNDDGDQSEDDEAVASATPQVVDLTLTKTVSDTAPNVGDMVTYTITIANAGPSSATGVGIADVTPSGVTDITDISDGGGLAGSTITWSGLSVPASGSIDLTFDATVLAPTGTPDEYLNIAEVTAVDQSDPDSVPNNDDGDQSEDDEDSVLFTPQQADLRLAKTVSDATPNVGDTVTFTIAVTNNGPDTATGVAVRDAIPAGYTGISNISDGGVLGASTIDWSGLAIVSGATLDLTFDAVVAAPTGAPGEYTNVAEIAAVDQFDPDSAPNNDDGDQSEDDEDEVDVVPQQVDLRLTKTVTSGFPNVGDTVVFTITVANAGPDEATGVTVADAVPAGYAVDGASISDDGVLAAGVVTWSGKTIAAGAAAVLTFEASVVAVLDGGGGLDAAAYRNSAQVAAVDQWDPDSTPGNLGADPAEDDEDDATTAPRISDLELSKGISNPTPHVDDTVTFSLTISNLGPDEATNVAIADVVPPGYGAIANITGDGTMVGSTITWTGLTIAPGGSITVTYRATVVAVVDGLTGDLDPTAYTNTAQVTAADQWDPDSTPDNSIDTEDDQASLTIVPDQADVSVTKTTTTRPNVGDTITVTITATNHGPDTATQIAVTDTLPTDLDFVTGSMTGGTSRNQTADPVLVWTIDSLANGASVDLTYQATVQAPTGAPGDYTNTVEVTAADQWDPDSSPDNDDGDQSEDDEAAFTIDPLIADLSIIKLGPVTTPNVGDTITYQIVVSNNGPDTATGIDVLDVLPGGLGYVATSATGGDSIAVSLPAITWTIDTLASGDGALLTYQAEVQAPTGTPGEFTNAAQVVAADQYDPDSAPGNSVLAEDDMDDVTIVPQQADLELTKAASPDGANVGDEITYTLTLTNRGPDTATGVAVADTVPLGNAYVATSIDFDAGTTGAVIVADDTGYPSTLAWTIDGLPSGAAVTLTYRTTINAPTGAPGEYTNLVEITAADQFDPDSGPANVGPTPAEDDEASVSYAVNTADLQVTKSLDDIRPNVGETVGFTVRLFNSGPGSATNVTVVDALPTGYANVTAVSSGGTWESGTATVTWDVASIAPGETIELTYEADVVAEPDGGGGLDPAAYVNSVEITATDTFDPDSTPGNGAPGEDDVATAAADPQVADVALTKLADAATTNIGDIVTFTVRVTNDGPDPATNVTVDDLLPAGYSYEFGSISGGSSRGVIDSTLSWTIALLNPGATLDLTYRATVVAVVDGLTGDLDPTAYTNTAQVTAADQWDPDSTPDNSIDTDDDQASLTIVPDQADVSVTKTTTTRPNVGDTITVTITATNHGPDTATQIAVTDTLPTDLDFVTGSMTGGTSRNQTADPVLVWTIDSLANGASVDLTYQATVQAPTGAPGDYTNTVEVTAADQWDPDSSPDNDDGDQSEDDEAAFTIDPLIADLSIIKLGPVTTPNVGDTITYQIRLSNDGPDTATAIAVRDVLPAGLTYEPASIGGDPGATGAVISPNDGAAPILSWTIDALPAASSLLLTYGVTVQSPTGAPGEYRNVAEITTAAEHDPDSIPGNGLLGEDDQDAYTLVAQQSDLSVAKAVSVTRPDVGQTVTYEITLANAGPDDATNVVVRDVVPAGLDYVPGSLSSDAGATGAAITGDETSAPILRWSVDMVPDGGSVVLTYDATVLAPTGIPGDYLNAAEITAADQYDPDSDTSSSFDSDDVDDAIADDDESAVALSPLQADVSIVKTAPGSRLDIGDTTELTITVSNAGPDPAVGLVVTDVLPSGLAYLAGTIGGDAGGSPAAITPDDTADPTLLWTIDSLPAGDAATLTYEVRLVGVASAGTLDPTAYVNTAEITGAATWDPDSDPTSGFPVDDLDDGLPDDDESSYAFDPYSADVALTKAVSDPTPNVGDVVTFTVTVTNTGPDTATGLAVEDTVPDGYTTIAAISNAGTTDGTTITWTGLTIGNGTTLDLTYQVSVTAPPAEYTNTAQVTAVDQFDTDSTPDNDDGDQSEDDETTAAVTPRQADVALTKTVSDPTPNVGDVVTFTVTVTNTGPDTATGLAVEDTVPDGYTTIAAISNAGTTDGTTITWTGLAIANGATLDLTYQVTVVTAVDPVTGLLDGPSYENTAQITATDQHDPDSAPDNDDDDQSEDDETLMAVTPAVLGVAKSVTTVSNNGNGTFTVSYLVTVRNLGLATIADLSVIDDVAVQFAVLSPTGFSATDGSLLANPTWDGGGSSNVLVTGQALTPGASGTVSIRFTVTPGDDLGPHDNTAMITGIAPTGGTVSDESTVGADPDPDDDADPAENTPTPVSFAESPMVGVAKAVAGEPINRNDGSFALTYEVLIENSGDVDLNGLSAVDDLTAVFPPPSTFSVTGVSSTAFTVNNDYDGVTDIDLLAGTDNLAVGDSGTLTIELVLWPDGATGPFENTVVATATSPAGIQVVDLSNDGTDPDPDGDDDPTDNEVPTPVAVPLPGTVTGRVWMDTDGDGLPDIDEADVVGATVILTCSGPDGVIGTGDDLVMETTIDSDSPATYTFTNVPPGSCEVRLDPDSLPATRRQTVDPDGVVDARTMVDVPSGGMAEANFGFVEPIDLAITKTAPASVHDGESITWTLTVTNVGTTVAVAPITITDIMPASIMLTSSTGDVPCSSMNDTVVCTRTTDLAPGDGFQISLVTTAGDRGTVVNTVIVDGAPKQTDQNPADNTDEARVKVGSLPHTGFELGGLFLIGLVPLLLGLLLIELAERGKWATPLDDPPR